MGAHIGYDVNLVCGISKIGGDNVMEYSWGDDLECLGRNQAEIGIGLTDPRRQSLELTDCLGACGRGFGFGISFAMLFQGVMGKFGWIEHRPALERNTTLSKGHLD